MQVEQLLFLNQQTEWPVKSSFSSLLTAKYIMRFCIIIIFFCFVLIFT